MTEQGLTPDGGVTGGLASMTGSDFGLIITKLFLDASAIIHMLESGQEPGQLTRLLVDNALKAGKSLAVSRLSMLECRVWPLKSQNRELLDCYDDFFRLPGLEIVEIDAIVMDLASDLHAGYSGSLRLADAIQLACAVASGADFFLTGNKKLEAVQDIKIVVV